MQTIQTPAIARVVHTASARSSVYGITEDGRVFCADGSDAPEDRVWSSFGVMGHEVKIGHPLIVVVDDMLSVTSPVIASTPAPPQPTIELDPHRW